MSEFEDLWFFAEHGERSGPFSREELERSLRDSKRQSGLVWRPGWSEWQPVAMHFGVKAPALDAQAPLPLTADGDSDREIDKPKKWIPLWLVALGIAPLAAYGVLFSSVNFAPLGQYATQVYTAVWVGALIAALAFSLFVWRFGDRASRSGKARGGLSKASAVLTSLAALSLSVMFARLTDAMSDVLKARTDLGAYEIEYIPMESRILITGTLSGGFAQELKSVLKLHPDVDVIELSSPGGLIDEALEAARAIESLPSVRTSVKDECNSACILLFLSAKQRSAEYAAIFGFHAQSNIVHGAPYGLDALLAKDTKFRQFMSDRGVPAHWLDQADAVGPKTLYPVSAIQMNQAGLLNALTKDERPINIPQAKWYWIAHILGARDETSAPAELAAAFGASSNERILASVEDVYAAIVRNDVKSGKLSVLKTISQSLPEILESADPQLGYDYIKASVATAHYLESMQLYEECANVADGKPLENPRVVPTSVSSKEILALTLAIRSAETAGWIKRPLPTWAPANSRATLAAANDFFARQGVDLSNYQSDPKLRCRLVAKYFDLMIAKPPTVAVAEFRALIAFADPATDATAVQAGRVAASQPSLPRLENSAPLPASSETPTSGTSSAQVRQPIPGMPAAQNADLQKCSSIQHDDVTPEGRARYQEFKDCMAAYLQKYGS